MTARTTPSATILVTGATGTHGGTGGAVVGGLLARGSRVRAMVRTDDVRAAALRARGAEVVQADFADYESMLRALKGVSTAYFCYPVAPGITEAAGLFAAAGREQGLSRVVDLSLAAASPTHPSPQGRAQWVAEQAFEWAGFSGVHLRIAAFFMENLVRIHGHGIRHAGRIANAFGDKELSWIAGQDVGAMAVELLLSPDPTLPRTLKAGGTTLMRFAEVAEQLSTVTGKPVRYEELSPEAWHREMTEEAEAAGAPNPRGIDHLVAQSKALRAVPRLLVTDHVQQLTGREPISFAQFAGARLSDLTPLN